MNPSKLRLIEMVSTPDFLGIDLSKCDMTEAYHSFGEGKTAHFTYRLEHITRQYHNDGVGTITTITIEHNDEMLMNELEIKDYLLLHFAEFWI